MHAPTICMQDIKAKARVLDTFTPTRHATQFMDNETANRVVVLVRQIDVEILIKFFNAGQRTNTKS